MMRRSPPVIVIDDLEVSNRSGVLHSRPSDGVNPVFLLPKVGNEVQ